MFSSLTDIVRDSKIKIIICENKVNIINYEDILIFEDNQILIKTKYKTIKIKGENLVITKLELSEALIEGKIKSIDMGD